MAYFVPNFLLIISMKSILVHLAPPTQKNTKNCRKFGKNRFGLISIFSRLGPKSKKPLDQNFRLFLVILKRLLAWFYLLWGFQKSVLCDFQYFDINVRGRGSNFFSPNFLDVFLDVESDKKNRLKFWPSGAEKSPFFWFWPHTGQFFLVDFSKNQKNLSKVHVLWPILFQIFYWSFFWSPFWSIRSHLRKK